MITREVTTILCELAKKYPVLTITGPRQTGKTTLARAVFADKPYMNLEAPDVRAYALDDPRAFLAQFRGKNGGIIDEIQRAPALTSYIQTIVDEDDQVGQFILTGSQQFEMMNSVTQSLAGRTALIRLPPFSLAEAGDLWSPTNLDALLYRGFYPRIIDRDLNPTQALADYTATYLERDLRQLSRIHDLHVFETFLRLCAGRVGQVLNYKTLGDDAGVSHSTSREWLNLLETSYIIYRLKPYHANIKKRLVKSPKLYFLDVGLLCYLLGIENPAHITTHPARGFLFENLVIMETLKRRWNNVLPDNLYFYRDSNGTEVDLLWIEGGRILPIEIKVGQTVSGNYFTGIRAFARAMKNEHMRGIVVYGGREQQARTDVDVIPLNMLNENISKWSHLEDVRKT